MNEPTSDVDARDRMLLQRMAAGDRAALETLYRTYHGGLSRFLSRLTRRADLIEEIVNDCFWIAWRKAGSFHGDSRVSTWIMGIAYRCGLKALRQRGDEPVDDYALREGRGPSHDPDEDRELRDWLAERSITRRLIRPQPYAQGADSDRLQQYRGGQRPRQPAAR